MQNQMSVTGKDPAGEGRVGGISQQESGKKGEKEVEKDGRRRGGQREGTGGARRCDFRETHPAITGLLQSRNVSFTSRYKK